MRPTTHVHQHVKPVVRCPQVPVASLTDEYEPHMRMVLDAQALIHTIPACMFESADTMNAYLRSIPPGVSNSSNSAKLMVVPDWTGEEWTDVHDSAMSVADKWTVEHGWEAIPPAVACTAGDMYDECEVGPARLWNAVQVVPWPTAAGTTRAGDHPEVTAATGPDIAGAAAASELADAMGDGVDAALDDLFNEPEMLALLEQMKAVRESSLQAGQAGESDAQRAQRHAAAEQIAMQFALALGLEDEEPSDAEDEGADE